METKEMIFKNDEFGSFRSVQIDGEPYFVGKDIAEILGYKNTKDALSSHVDDEDKRLLQRSEFATIENHIPKEVFPVDFVQGDIPNRGLTIINESGLYSLIISSKLPSAKRFKHWITSEVLPAIRKHGVYAMDELLENPDTLIAALQSLKEERKKNKALQDTVAVQTQQIAEMQPKASYYDLVLNCKDLVPISVIAKDYGWSANKLNGYLNDKGIQYKQGNVWLLYQKYSRSGYTNTKTYSHPGSDGDIHTSVHTYWTQAGLLFLYNVLKEDGIFPTIERENKEKENG